MTMKYNVVDGHSHLAFETEEEIVGQNITMPKIPNILDYRKLASKNTISEVMFCPCTSPVNINKINNSAIAFCLWEYSKGKFNYFSETIEDGKIIRHDISLNPYRIINEKLSNYIESLNEEYNINFVPAINLYFDTEEYIDELISKKPKALKVHGVSTGIYDLNRINTNLLNRISKSNIPLVIHTDYYENPKSPIERIYYENNPINWINLLLKYNIKGYLAHGCRLSEESSEILKKYKGQFLVGISPDILLNNEPERLVKNTEYYLLDLLNMFDEDLLSFDIDYNWNYTDRLTNTFDDNQLNRINEYLKDENTKKKILTNNSTEFFKL